MAARKRLGESQFKSEKHRRHMVSLWAYAYEIGNHSLVPDDAYDREADCVDLSVSTDRPDLDEWFRENFDPDTGMWVHNHPDKERLAHRFRIEVRAMSAND